MAVGLVPLLYYLTATAEGAQPGGKSSLKWRSASSRTAAAAKTETNDDAVPADSAEPMQLEADVAAKPIDTAKPIGDDAKSVDVETKFVSKRSTDMRRDNQVRLTQATNPLKQPINTPFVEDNKSTLPTNPPGIIIDKMNTRTGTPDLSPLPRADDLAAANGGFKDEECPQLSSLKKISQITNVIAASAGDLPRECYFDETVIGPNNRNWMHTTYTWKASGLCHKPLYFEEVALERYGHSTGPISQPIVSGAHFFGTLPLLPYKMGLNPPWECKYALGYYRPGSCAPYIVPPVPISGRAIAAETAAVLGLIYILP